MQELIKGLRGELIDCKCYAYSASECGCDCTWPEHVASKAADLIESQAAEITKYKSLCDQLSDALNGLAMAMDLRLDDDDLSQESKEAFFALEAWRAMK